MLSTLTRPLVRLPRRWLSNLDLRGWLAATAHLVWPWRCPLCGATSSGEAGLVVCSACAGAVAAERLERHCPRCGCSRSSFEADSDVCPMCVGRQRAFAAIAVVGLHQGALRRLILRWKFGRSPGLEVMLGDMLSEAVAQKPWHADICGLVPVPQPWNRWVTRQFFPVGDLAERAGRRLGIPVWPVLRARRHRPQVGLSFEDRLRNVADVFRVRGSVDLRDRALCLIDDVTTTGATLQAAAAALTGAGAGPIYAAVVAKAGG